MSWLRSDESLRLISRYRRRHLWQVAWESHRRRSRSCCLAAGISLISCGCGQCRCWRFAFSLHRGTCRCRNPRRSWESPQGGTPDKFGSWAKACTSCCWSVELSFHRPHIHASSPCQLQWSTVNYLGLPWPLHSHLQQLCSIRLQPRHSKSHKVSESCKRRVY